MDSLNLRSRVHGLSVRAAQLEGARKAGLEQSAQLTTDVSLAKGRGALGEEVSRVFDAMQQRSHERSVGSLEVLLTAVLQDVLPDEGAIRMLPQYKSNATHLDIALQKNGFLEDVLDGNGGAVTNVVSVGLRFAALVRTTNRRLMALDEPDCWLKPERVPAFVRTLSQVAIQTGTQTFFITHHDPSFFEGQFNLVRFAEDKDGLVSATALTPQVTQWANDEEVGIRAIELFNVRRHEHTLVPCYPGGTAYVGDNNLGKSTALLTSLKVVAYGESDDTLIRHGCEEARIVLYLEKNKRIEWSRQIKRSPAVIYKLYQGTELLAEGRPKARNQAPEWVSEVLRIARVDELDIQVGNQKSPVFLLNESAPRRAQILSVGRESSYLKELMKGYESIKATDREVVKQGEMALARLKLRLSYLEQIVPLQVNMGASIEQAEALIKNLDNKEQLEKLLAKLETSSRAASTLAQECDVLESVPVTPVLASEADVKKLIDQLCKSAYLAEVHGLPKCPVMPELEVVLDLARVAKRLEGAKDLSAIAAVPAIPAVPELANLVELTRLGGVLAKSAKISGCFEGLPASVPALLELNEGANLLAMVTQLMKAIAAIEQEDHALKRESDACDAGLVRLEQLKEELGECPLCNSAFIKETGGHSHAH